MNERVIIILFAYILDLILGDPEWMPHPVKGVGYLAKKLEAPLCRIFAGRKRLAGIIFVVIILGLVYFAVSAIIVTANQINRVLGFLISVFLVYSALAIKDLRVESMRVYKALERKDLGEARKKLSLIVGRDTANLNENEVIRASVETVAESAMDGIIAPLFYAFLGGSALVWIYKAINTLDSMVGYRNERFIEFGKASAKLDGLANLIPAKITSLLIGISAGLCGKDWISSFGWGFRYFLRGQDNNSIIAEAAMAGALGVQLGGVNFYNSVPIPKPLIGDGVSVLEISHIRESIKIVYLCSFLFLLIGTFVLLKSN